MADYKNKSILTNLLRILTPEEIDDLSKIYLSFFRRTLTSILDKKLEIGKKESGISHIPQPPPIPKIKRIMKKGENIPPKIEQKVTGGVVFILEEKERFSEINKEQKKLKSNYSKNLKLSEKPSKGVLINKKCS